MKKASASLLLALGLALLAGCSASSGTGSVQLAVSVPQALSSSVSRVSVTVSAADQPSVSVDLVFSNGSWGGLMSSLPVGSHRTFLARAFDASGTPLYEGSASGISISANQTTLVALTLQQLNAPPPFQNAAPFIDSLVGASVPVAAGGTLSLVATAHDPNAGDTLSYAWSATEGSFSQASAASTSWTAPSTSSYQTLSLTVTDSGGLSSSVSMVVYVAQGPMLGSAEVSISFNLSPEVASLSAAPTRLAVGQPTAVSVSASDLEGDSLSYAWSASCAGSWANASSSSAQFTPSALPFGECNNCRLTVTISDGRGGRSTGTVALCVSNAPTTNHLQPVIVAASNASSTAAPGQVLTYEVMASDPEGTALSFSWTATAGLLGTADHGASSSRITWKAPSCVRSGPAPQLTVTITNGFHQSITQSFSITGPPLCPPPSWASTGDMLSPRSQHTATLLNNGKVLVAGGEVSSGALATAELYDPATNTWSVTGPMRSPRVRHTATPLLNGKVLVSGGGLTTAELYDPASGTWSDAGAVAPPRSYSTATPRPNGRVLLSGGDARGNLSLVEYDPSAGTWSAIGAVTSGRGDYTATLLPDGRLLMTGGMAYRPLAAAEAYDPAADSWSAAGAMAVHRFFHTAVLLSTGKLLILGGGGFGGDLALAEVYDPASSTFSPAGTMSSQRVFPTVTQLSDGRVLVAGGYSTQTSSHAGAEEYDPASGTWSPAGTMGWPRAGHTATLLPNGQVLVTGGYDPTGYLAQAELYTP